MLVLFSDGKKMTCDSSACRPQHRIVKIANLQCSTCEFLSGRLLVFVDQNEWAKFLFLGKFQ
jgi:hypothetical protein